MMTRPILGALLALAAAGAAQAAETPAERELRLLGRCGAATNLYASLMPPAKAPVEITEADRTLWTQVQAVTPKLAARANLLAMEVGGERATAIRNEIVGQAKALLRPVDGPPPTPRALLDLYAPVLETCLAKAAALPEVQ